MHGDEGITIYSASKSSLKGAVASLTKEYARFKQEFYIISLGLFDSGLATKLSDEVKDRLIQQTAYTELVTPEDVFNCLMYIGVSSAAAGSTISDMDIWVEDEFRGTLIIAEGGVNHNGCAWPLT